MLSVWTNLIVDCSKKSYRVNSLQNNKILNQSKLKAFAGDKINMTEKLKFVLGRVENIVGKRRKC